MASTGSSALEGLRVLEISAAGNWAASLLGMLLADQGASVTKLGAPPDPLITPAAVLPNSE